MIALEGSCHSVTLVLLASQVPRLVSKTSNSNQPSCHKWSFVPTGFKTSCTSPTIIFFFFFKFSRSVSTPNTNLFHPYMRVLSHADFVCPCSSRAHRDHTELLRQSQSLLVMLHHLTAYRKNTVIFSNFRFGKFIRKGQLNSSLEYRQGPVNISVHKRLFIYNSCMHKCMNARLQLQ